MKLLVMLAVAALLCTPVAAQERPARPQITGIGSVSIDVADNNQAVDFYIKDLGFGAGVTICEGGSRFCLGVNNRQRIDVLTPATPKDKDYLEEVTFQTSNLGQMKSYLIASGFKTGEIREASGANRHFSMTDPEGHRIGFIQYLVDDKASHPENQVSAHIIHAGFVVRDRAATDHFYKDTLGFRPYWHGGMKDNEDSWVAMQVPDGTDWVEYMLNISPTADKHTLGVMNHIALGVTDIQAAKAQLIKNGWKPGEEPKLGRDGKWQLNIYDPDDTRVEFMEFTPKEKPCCSEFTGPHPGPKP
jgi:catechol 2,3-dioxygenase-like lactoylglutathione lyase family enzyme